MIKNRSLIFIPAKEKMLNKIKEFNADIYIIDLEDSIENAEKENALNILTQYLDNMLEKSNIFVRINSDNYLKELEMLEKYKEIGFMLPKFEYGNQYDDVEAILKEHEVIALIESPLGIVNIQEIVAREFVNAVAFGAEDYTAKVNMKNNKDNLIYQKSRIVNYSKAYNKKVFDTPSFKINDYEGFKEEVESSVDLGFDGKLLIHPKHIEYINDAFGNIDLEKYKDIIGRYEESKEAVVVIDGVVYEKMHINRMKKIIKENGEG